MKYGPAAAAVSATLWILSPTARGEPAPPIAALLAQPPQLAAWLAARDPRVEAQRARVDAANAAARQARALPNPQLQLGVSDLVLGKTNASAGEPGSESPPLPLSRTLIYTAAIEEQIELGKRGPRQAAADARSDEAAEQAVGALGDQVGEATLRLGRLAHLAARRAVVANNLDAAHQRLALERERVAHQDLSALDLARFELEAQAIALQLARADAELAAAASACRAVLRAPCPLDGLDEPAVLIDAAPLPAALPPPAIAIAARAEQVADRLEVRALDADAALAHNRRIPDPTIGVGYTLDNLTVSGDQHQSLMFTLGVPLPVFDRGDHDEAAARAAGRARAAEARAARTDAEAAIAALASQRAMLEAAIARLETETVPTSSRVIAQTRRAFDLGQTPLADLLLAERAHRDLLLELLDDRFELFTVRAQLRHELGLDDQAARTAGGKPTR